eukprot:CAMPEP_0195128932 /NCGR_PEP_ID=MMETSP0448-20130528/140234_1 /TAXON_ID=66468 /ORGANISM="Heterocapsa triquestra, Strain CCMP 448" /LENGTH=52 /DNA_ID=CAMNT_0040166751 /DNA_START=1 /DNA_END=155 /DNA_ORIENTATION=-
MTSFFVQGSWPCEVILARPAEATLVDLAATGWPADPRAGWRRVGTARVSINL